MNAREGQLSALPRHQMRCLERLERTSGGLLPRYQAHDVRITSACRTSASRSFQRRILFAVMMPTNESSTELGKSLLRTTCLLQCSVRPLGDCLRSYSLCLEQLLSCACGARGRIGSIGLCVVCRSGKARAADLAVAGGLPAESRLHGLWSRKLDARARQVKGEITHADGFYRIEVIRYATDTGCLRIALFL
jgi:hypothetical protein